MKKLSDILEEAAAGYESGEYNEWDYSCLVVAALIPYDEHWSYRRYVFTEGIEEMGLKYWDSNAFDNVPISEQSKARMMWLTWAAMMAREQGL